MVCPCSSTEASPPRCRVGQENQQVEALDAHCQGCFRSVVSRGEALPSRSEPAPAFPTRSKAGPGLAGRLELRTRLRAAGH